jgi:cell filamentation protein, protein adenylyltransferase
MRYDVLDEKKALLDRQRPLPEALVRNLDEWFRVELTYTSNAIEGNTLTRRETALVVEKGLTVGGKSLTEHLEATNHAYAIDWVRAQVERNPQDVDERDILRMHALVLKGIDDSNAGRYRNIGVRISGSTVVLPHPFKVPDLMAAFTDWLRHPGELHPVELAAEAHYRLVTIHPFVDGNGRTARLLMNMLLLMNGYPAAIIQKRERLKYIGSLEKAQLGGSKDEFLRLISRAVERSLDIYSRALSGAPESDSDEGRLLKIGDLAKRVGVANSTIRHWTKEGLLEVADVTDSGYQLYATDMVERIAEIHAMKKKRYTLQEIKAALSR